MTLERTKSGWSVGLRYGKGRRNRFAMPAMTEAAALERQRQLGELAVLLTGAPHLNAKKILAATAAMPTDKAFAGAVRAAKDAAAGTAPAPAPEAPKTFRDVAELWLSGDLHRRFPDVVKGKAEHSVAQSRGLLRTIYPHLDKPVTEITRADVLRAKADATPAGVSQATRAGYARHIRIVLGLAVTPLELIDQSPVPPKFVPSYGQKPALGFLYPDEDALLLSQPDDVVPYGYRWFYGFQVRNGMRPSEGLRLTFGDLDLRLGVLRLDRNKTKVPRAWRMADDVIRQLRLEWARLPESEQIPERLVFPDVDHDDLAERFREHLWAAGVRRRELHQPRTAERRPIRVHDLRGSFVTIALAHGANEDWVMSRTGHTTSAMLAKYRRQAKHAQELDLGWYQPIDRVLAGHAALPVEMVAAEHPLARGLVRREKAPVEMPGFQTSTWSYVDAVSSVPEPKTAAAASASVPAHGTRAAESQGVARSYQGEARPQTGAMSAPEDTAASSADPVERALAFAITEATRAGRWDVVLAATTELSRRELHRSAPQVTSLEAARRKREEGGK